MIIIISNYDNAYNEIDKLRDFYKLYVHTMLQ